MYRRALAAFDTSSSTLGPSHPAAAATCMANLVSVLMQLGVVRVVGLPQWLYLPWRLPLLPPHR